MLKGEEMKDQQKQEIKNLNEIIRYWKNKCEELNIKIKSLEDYKRGMNDALYYLGSKR